MLVFHAVSRTIPPVWADGDRSARREDDDGRDPRLAAARVRVWEALSTNSRQTFSWPPPGEKRASADAFQHPAPVSPPPNFALIILKPERVERLDLTQHPHKRILYSLAEDASWSQELLNPQDQYSACVAFNLRPTRVQDETTDGDTVV
ncbi:MAG: hypothetical protein WKF84_10210 [Pyrinomonadaceae bacterium]